jgi:hypothetical protein
MRGWRRVLGQESRARTLLIDLVCGLSYDLVHNLVYDITSMLVYSLSMLVYNNVCRFGICYEQRSASQILIRLVSPALLVLPPAVYKNQSGMLSEVVRM